MSPEVRREVTASTEFLHQLERYFRSSYEILIREVLPYVFEAFRQEWDNLPLVLENEPRTRVYEFIGDLIPHGYFIGQLAAVSVTDPFYIVEQIELIDVIIHFDDEPLEDPDDPTPDR